MPNRKKQERREFKIKLNEILKRIQRKRLKFEERKSLFAVHPHPLIMNPKLIFQDVSKKIVENISCLFRYVIIVLLAQLWKKKEASGKRTKDCLYFLL